MSYKFFGNVEWLWNLEIDRGKRDGSSFVDGLYVYGLAIGGALFGITVLRAR